MFLGNLGSQAVQLRLTEERANSSLHACPYNISRKTTGFSPEIFLNFQRWLDLREALPLESFTMSLLSTSMPLRVTPFESHPDGGQFNHKDVVPAG